MVDAVDGVTCIESSDHAGAGAEDKSLFQKEKHHEIFYSYGMECAIHQGEKIKGVLKTIPADFIVIEIDKNGELVTINKDCPILDPPIDNQTSSKQESPEPPPLEEEDDDSNPLTEKQMLELSDLSRKFEEMSDTQTSVLSETVDLGCYDNKKVRARIHKSVKDNFPILSTRTIHNDEDIQQIIGYPDSSYTRLLPLLGKEETIKLLHYIKSSDPTERKSHLIPCDHQSKEDRRQIHQIIDELFGFSLVTTTVDVSIERKSNRKRPRNHEGSINIINSCLESPVVSSESSTTLSSSSGSNDAPSTVSVSSNTAVSSSGSDGILESGSSHKHILVNFKARIRRSAKRRKMGCPVTRDQNYYTSFSLKKENFEIFLTITKLADVLSVNPSRFGFAGNKDKKAITYQKMTAKNISMSKLAAVNIPDIELGSFEYVPNHLHLGDHKGNHFQIRVRDLETITTNGKDSLEDIIKGGCKSLEEKGFINYFGAQRFGRLIDNHPLNGPIVGYYMILDDPLNAIKAMFSPDTTINLEAKEAKEYFARTGDVDGTIHRMPEVPRELMVLRNLSKYGTSKFGCQKSLLSLPYQSRRLYISAFTSLLWNQMASYRIQEYGTEPVEGDLVLVAKLSGQTVQAITSEHISSRQYSLKDIVLPVCGHKSVLPNNRVGDRLKELLAALGISLLSFRSYRYTNHLWGAYRKLISYPRDLRWRLTKAPPFIASIPPAPSGAAATLNTPGALLEEAGSSGRPQTDGPPEDSKPCLELEFTLDPGNYVTTMMNEILSFDP